MRAQVDQKFHPYILTFVGDIKPYKDALAISQRDTPYFFVLDEDGKIVYSTSGAYSEAKMSQVEQIIDDF
jgi:predicted transcriptional regulator